VVSRDSKGKRVVGYCDPLSVAPGDTVRFMVSSLDGESFDAKLVRLICGDVSPGGHGFDEEEVESTAEGRHLGVEQPLRPGSYAVVDPHPLLANLGSLVVEFALWPTRPCARPQVLVSTWERGSGFAVLIDGEGRLAAEVGTYGGDRRRLSLAGPVPARRWTRVRVVFDEADGSFRVACSTIPQSPSEQAVYRPSEASCIVDAVVASRGPLVFGAELGEAGVAKDHFNGRLDECRLGDDTQAEPSVRWDFSIDLGTDRIIDVGAHGLHGRTVQLPARAVPGVRWNGDVHDWRLDPSHYGAIHFHDDDLVDAGWDPSFMLDLPVDIPSGVYALRLRTSTSEDYVPFFVVPGPQTGRADVAYLAPTVTYRAYANARLTARPDRIFGSGAQQQVENDRFLFEHPRVGLGTYERHSDGSGVMFSSHLRPVLNLKPKGGVWSFTADTNVTAWLRHTGVSFDVLTDDVLHAEGAALLEPYRVILTGTHPEYWTTPMLDALEAYLAGGGRLLYLGANGFYWRTSFHDAAPGTIEVRRAEDGARAWIAEPGEYHHESTGELGGLWRRLGRPPNRLVGVGFAAQGFTTSGHYRRSAGWSDPLVGFATEGLSEAEVFGDHGVIGGGAAGQEIDRYDRELGSPAHAVVLASSEDLPDDMLLTKEELFATGFPGAEIRADVVFVTGPCGGAVFSVGSIAWAASLATNGYDNDLAKLTDNVLRRFVDPAPLLPSVDSPTD
jgi:N,N-dimethylformamidase